MKVTGLVLIGFIMIFASNSQAADLDAMQKQLKEHQSELQKLKEQKEKTVTTLQKIKKGLLDSDQSIAKTKEVLKDLCGKLELISPKASNNPLCASS